MMSWNLTQAFSFHGHRIARDRQGVGSSLVMGQAPPPSSFNLRHLIKGLATYFSFVCHVPMCSMFPTMTSPRVFCWLLACFSLLGPACQSSPDEAGARSHASSPSDQIQLLEVGLGWAANSINAVIFRRNSVVSHEHQQYVAYYNPDGKVMLARRELGTEAWEVVETPYTGNVNDAHNSISIMVDGEGYLHMCWDHHVHPLRYVRSVAPGSLELTEKMPMTGQKEAKVTYPEFYRLPNGNLLFLYRDGSSGNGSLILNHYDTATQTWTQRQENLIDGEGERNAYWQMCTDAQGWLHLSWVWRETGGVETNHDMGYAVSKDAGRSWQRTDGSAYAMPINQANAEYAARIPQQSELINTTSMYADGQGRPYIVSYWRPEGTEVPQYQLVYHDGRQWAVQQISQRKTPFRLSGGGTKRIPISRPQVLAREQDGRIEAYLLFRDAERDKKVSLAVCEDLQHPSWQVQDLTDFSVDQWEPSYDTQRWQEAGELHVFVQRVEQGDGEKVKALGPQPVYVLVWEP